MSRQEQKLKTRQNIIHAAFSLLDENRSLSAISLREVAREAGIAPTSFYRHFKDMDELGWQGMLAPPEPRNQRQ